MNKALPYNFGGLSAKYSSFKNSKIVVLPVPFDKTSSWIKGADKGPRAIISASMNMELYDIESGSEVYTKGIYTAKEINAGNSSAMNKKVFTEVKKHLEDDKFVVLLGGEHSVSLGSIQAHAQKYKNLSILHLDAHSDMRESYEGDKYSHACIMARAKEVTDTIVSAGIRSMDSSELGNIYKKNTFYASVIRKSDKWMQNAVNMLTENVYITVDLDVFDPSIMPSTGTPEPGGMGWYQVLDLIESVSKKKKIVGFDVVELCPSKHNLAPDFLTAKLIYKMLSLIFVGASCTSVG